MEYRFRSWVNMVAAVIARVGRATLDAVMLRDLFAVFAVDSIGVKAVLQPLKTGCIVGKLAVEVFLGVRRHFRFSIHRLTYSEVECSL